MAVPVVQVFLWPALHCGRIGLGCPKWPGEVISICPAIGPGCVRNSAKWWLRDSQSTSRKQSERVIGSDFQGIFHDFPVGFDCDVIHTIHPHISPISTQHLLKGFVCTNQMHELGAHVHHRRPSNRIQQVSILGLTHISHISHISHMTPDAFQGVVFVVKAIEPLTTALLAIPLLSQTFNLRLLGIAGWEVLSVTGATRSLPDLLVLVVRIEPPPNF